MHDGFLGRRRKCFWLFLLRRRFDLFYWRWLLSGRLDQVHGKEFLRVRAVLMNDDYADQERCDMDSDRNEERETESIDSR